MSKILLLVGILFLLGGCSMNTNQSNISGNTEITASVIEDARENCRLSNESDCRPIEIRKGEAENEEHVNNFTEDISIESKSEKNITIQNLLNLTLVCEAGWKCIEGRYTAYQEANCSWHSLERCIYGCNENESACRTAPICKVNSLRCENDNLMVCGEEGYRWLLNKSCDKNCEDNICTEDLGINATLNITTNNTTQNEFISDNCISVLNFNYDPAGNNLSQEYFTLKNSCHYSVDMGGWTARDNTTMNSHIFTFPVFNLDFNAELSVHTGNGTNTSTDLYYRKKIPIWNDEGGDTLYLNTSNGTSVLICPYPNNGSISNCPDL